MNEVPTANSGASKNKKPFPWTWIVLAIVLGVPVFFIGSCLLLPTGIVYEADAGFRRAKHNIDAEKFRSWALQSINNYSGTNGYSQHIPISEIPDYITNLYSISPDTAWVTPKSNDSEASVVILWGGGFFHWGFYVGPTNFLMTSFGDHQIAEWTSGIYYMHEGNRKIR